jgi:hypothetical protein
VDGAGNSLTRCSTGRSTPIRRGGFEIGAPRERAAPSGAPYLVSSIIRARNSQIAIASAIAGCRKRRVRRVFRRSSPPSPPAEKATARQDQPGQPCTCDGAGNVQGLIKELDIV